MNQWTQLTLTRRDRRTRPYDENLRQRGARLGFRVTDVPPKGTCWMCGQDIDIQNREHIFPSWLQRRFDAQREVFTPTHFDRFGQTIDKRGNIPASAFVAGEICQQRCNGGWMSELETEFERTLFSKAAISPLSDQAKRVIARWFSKTAIVISISQNYRTLVPAKQRRSCTRGVPHGFSVYLADGSSTPQDRFDFAQGANIISLIPNSSKGIAAHQKKSDQVFACVIRVDTLVGIVVFAPPGRWAVPEAASVRIWPPSDTAVSLAKLPRIEPIVDGLVLIDRRLEGR